MRALTPVILAAIRADFAAEQLTIAIDRGASVRVLDVLVAQRVAALEELGEALRLIPTSDSAFVPHCDKHVKPNRQNRTNKPAA